MVHLHKLTFINVVGRDNPLVLYETFRIMKNILPFVLALCVQFAICQSYEITAERWQLVQQYLNSQEDLSGTILMVSSGKIKINHSAGYANRALEQPYNDQKLSTIGSITKSFTATAILLLQERGSLNVKDPISKYFEHVPADKNQITLHQLLTHTAGFPGAIGDDYESISTKEFQQLAWQEQLLFAPGQDYEYSNVGYSLLGMIIELVSKQNYTTFLQENILGPAGMINCGYAIPASSQSKLTHGYEKNGADWGTSTDKNWNGDEPYWHLKANGGLLMSSQNMYKWYMALRSNTILSPALLALQTAPYADEGGGSYYGYGYAVDQQGDCIQHNGGNGIFKADFRWFPKLDLFLFAASNDANVRLFKLTDEILHILLTGEWPKEENWEQLTDTSFPKNENESTVQAFIELIQSYSVEKSNAFIPEYCTTAIIDRNGKDRLQEIFQMLHIDIKESGEPKVFSSGQKMLVVMDAKEEGSQLKITLQLVDHKIERLGAEIEMK